MVFKIMGLVHQLLVGVATVYLVDDSRLLSDVGRRPAIQFYLHVEAAYAANTQ